jgi:chromate transporter
VSAGGAAPTGSAPEPAPEPAPASAPASVTEVFRVALGLGCRAFGGPVAHLGYFEREYVARRRWLQPAQYAGIVALCQLLPGPTSSQVGFLVGWQRAGWRGALAAWAGFTLPATMLMALFATYAARRHGAYELAVLHGFKLVAVVVVAQAVSSMATRLCPDVARRAIAVLVAASLVLVGNSILQELLLAASAVAGWFLCRESQIAGPPEDLRVPTSVAAAAGTAFLALLSLLPIAAAHRPHGALGLADICFRAGALVFGGGHVVLPLLREALVPNGWISDARFLDGYGAAQALPGPLFAIAAYLGVASAPAGYATAWAAVAVISLFLPGMLLAVAGLGAWRYGARLAFAGAALAGINAGVVGVLAAALYDPVIKSAIHSPVDAGIAVAGFVLLERLRWAPLLVVVFCTLAAIMSAAALPFGDALDSVWQSH